MNYSRKRIYNPQNHMTLQKLKNMKTFRVSNFLVGPKNDSSSSVTSYDYSCLILNNMPFVLKLNPEFSSYLLKEAKAIIALSLFLQDSKKKAIIVSFQ